MFGIRNVLMPSAAWLTVLPALGAPVSSLDATARLIGTAIMLGTFTVVVYRLGVWRQEMEQTKDRVVAELQTHREESAQRLDRIERRLEAMDHMLAAAADQHTRAARWRSRAADWLERLEEGARQGYLRLPERT